jgi:hypothetical protein
LDAVAFSGTAVDINIAEKGCLRGQETLYTEADLTQPGSVEKSVAERRAIRWGEMTGDLEKVREEYKTMYGVGGTEANPTNLARCLHTVDLCMNMFNEQVLGAVQRRVVEAIEGEWNPKE